MAPTASDKQNIQLLLQVLSHATLSMPDWSAIAAGINAPTRDAARIRFKRLIEKYGHKFTNGRITKKTNRNAEKKSRIIIVVDSDTREENDDGTHPNTQVSNANNAAKDATDTEEEEEEKVDTRYLTNNTLSPSRTPKQPTTTAPKSTRQPVRTGNPPARTRSETLDNA